MLVGLPLASQAAPGDAAIVSARASALVNSTYISFTSTKVRGKSTADSQAAALASLKASALALANAAKGNADSESIAGQAIAQALSEALSKGYLSGDGVSQVLAAIKGASPGAYAALSNSGAQKPNLVSFFPTNNSNQQNQTYTPPGSGSTSVNVAATTSVSDGQVK